MAWSMGLLGASLPSVAAGAYDLLETQVLGAAAASVTFTGLDSYTDYKHLQLRNVQRTTRASNTDGCYLRFNGDSGSNYARHYLYGDGSSIYSGGSTSQTQIGLFNRGAGDTNFFAIDVIDILDFSDANKNTTVRVFEAEDRVWLISGLWNSTSAVTSITFTPQIGPDFAVGSRFSLYGVK